MTEETTVSQIDLLMNRIDSLMSLPGRDLKEFFFDVKDGIKVKLKNVEVRKGIVYCYVYLIANDKEYLIECFVEFTVSSFRDGTFIRKIMGKVNTEYNRCKAFCDMYDNNNISEL